MACLLLLHVDFPLGRSGTSRLVIDSHESRGCFICSASRSYQLDTAMGVSLSGTPVVSVELSLEWSTLRGWREKSQGTPADVRSYWEVVPGWTLYVSLQPSLVSTRLVVCFAFSSTDESSSSLRSGCSRGNLAGGLSGRTDPQEPLPFEYCFL